MEKRNRSVGIDKDWFFIHSDEEKAKDVLCDHSAWEKVNLPHDWSTGYAYDKNAPNGRRGGFTRTGVGWYRKILFVTSEMLEKRVCIEFDGIYANSDVYINGIFLGHRPYGYMSFYYELSQHLVEGANIIAVRVDCEKQESSRWYNGCGIYRHVWLTVTEKVYVDTWGTYISTPKAEADEGMIKIAVDICHDLDRDIAAHVIHRIRNAANDVVIKVSKDVNLTVEKHSLVTECVVKKPDLWSLERPHLYTCETTIMVDDKAIDCYVTRFGIRQLAYIANKGFYLNGVHTKFKGVCIHHDSGVVGAAVPDKILRKKLQLLKDMGCNAIRTAHNPFAPVFYDICDELGMMVMDEIFDGWDIAKGAYDYGLYFKEWHVQDCLDFIKRDRNHPSIVIWSLGNEVKQMQVDMTKKLMALFHEWDSTRPVTCGVNGISESSEANRAILDIAGYNDGGGACFLYDKDHETRPDQLMIATEAPHTCQTRGFYRTQTWWRDKNQARIEIDNLCEEELFFDGDLAYRSSYDNAGVRVCIRDSWNLSEARPYVLGEFRWTGFDYYGESHGWPARWHDCGVIGMENIPKDAYYLYQSMWTHKPMVHLLPHWTHPHMTIGTKIPVWVYSNCQEVELVLNGESHGRKVKGNGKHLQWDVPYVPGNVEAIGYIKGIEAVRKGYQTAGVAAKLRVESDGKTLAFDGIDTAQIHVSICDKHDVMVPSGDNIICFKAKGNVKLLGTENGNCIDLTALYAHQRKAFNGLCMAVVQSVENKDRIHSGIYCASILGESVFEEKTSITVDIDYISFHDDAINHGYEILIKWDSGCWQPYSKPMFINRTTHVEVKIYDKHNLLFHITSLFVKGKREKVIDLTHGNRIVNLEVPQGPFAREVSGFWTDGQFTFNFKPDGRLVRVLSTNQEQPLGYWWYDFPIDPFEFEDYAGQGEIWFDSGEKNACQLVTQAGNAIRIHNKNGAIRKAFNQQDELVFYRLCETD